MNKIVILMAAIIFGLTAFIGSAQTNDSIVSLEADIAQLSLLPASDVPNSGTFWLVTASNGMAAPFPCIPPNVDLSNANTYLLPNNAYLIDATEGDAGATLSQITQQGNAVSNIIVQASAVAAATSQTMGMRAMAMDDSGPLPPGGSGGGSGTNDNGGVTSSYVAPDYGTNLWIAQWEMGSNNLATGIASNTLSDVSYQLQYITNLTQTNWISIGGPILGSALTNWTPLNDVAVNLTNNMFFRLQSEQSSDGSGLPDWWEEEYFGTNTVNPNAQDSAGDGWTIYQKYEMGDDPNTFVTPAAPQNVTASYNAGTGVATISWQPALGNVTGYTITDSAGGSYMVSASTTSIQINATNSAYLYFADPSLDETFQVEGDYLQGNSALSGAVPVERSSLSAQIVPGPSNVVYLAISGIPTNTVSFSWITSGYDELSGYSTVTNFIPASAITNGLFLLPSGWGGYWNMALCVCFLPASQ